LRKNDFLNLKFILRGGCAGGKGGFGSLLRNAKSLKKTTNFGSCRDLNGRKLRDVQNEKKLAEWTENQQKLSEVHSKAKHQKKDKEELIVHKNTIISIEKSQNKNKDDASCLTETKTISLRVSESVEKGLAKQKQIEELKRKREEVPLKLFGFMEDDDISESDLSEEEEIAEQKSKKRCIVPTSLETSNSLISVLN